jgi:hypothetical protein
MTNFPPIDDASQGLKRGPLDLVASGTASPRGIDLNQLEQEAEKLLQLLRDRHPGLSVWNDALLFRLRSLDACIAPIRE